ncbi:MAG: 16S rRNA (cytosine(1402)-N(4))-methyltransferase RsmH [Halobacteriovoraceae bacterium]|nr:16S rRNA (cytosine(1402)-N(4))-methyltransferase RsmH [Halobacteriovoraceae bacterium]
MDSEYSEHSPVLLAECLEYLQITPTIEGWGLDLTFGGGGHAFSFLERASLLKILATDQDSDAIANGKAEIAKRGFEERLKLFHMNFHNFFLKEEYTGYCDQGFHYVLADLGVSSHHFDSPDRGFSFRFDGPLDMRMDREKNKVKASDIVNQYTEGELEELIRNFGEERFSKRIANKIVNDRANAPIETTKQLEEICFFAYPGNARKKGIHPATRTFQALRIEVNDELKVLEESLEKMFSVLKPGGRLGIISFHSLEDRIVKQTFKKINQNTQVHSKIITKRPISAGKEELKVNKRSRSAKLRVIEK